MKKISEKEVNTSVMRYDHDKKILQVELTSGKKFNYLNVPEEIWEEAIKTPAIGKFFTEKIRWSFEFEQTEDKL